MKAGFKKTKVGIIPRDWDCTVFSKIFERISKPVITKPNEIYREIGIRSHGKGIFHKPPVKGIQLGNKRVFYTEVGTLVFNIVFAWEQAVAILSQKEKGFIASHRFPMYKAKNGNYEPFFLRFFLTPKGKHILSIASPGGAGRNKTLGQRELDFLYVPVPSFKEQKAISDLISLWDKAIEKIKALIIAEEKQFKWLLKTLISDQEVKTGWRKVKVGDVFKLGRGRVIGKEEIEKNSGIYPVYSSQISNNGILGRINSYDFEGEYLTWTTDGANAGTVFFRNGKFNCTNVCGIAKSVNDNIIDCRFSAYQLNIYAKKFVSYIGNPKLMNNIFAEIPFRFPKITEQKDIADILHIADYKLSLLKQLISKYKKQKKGLMQKILTGKCRIKVNDQEE